MATLMENVSKMTDKKMSVDFNRDLPYKKDFTTNSWFTITHFTDGKDKLSMLYHTMIFSFEGKPGMCSSCISVTNETTGEYFQSSKAYQLDEIHVETENFMIETPVSRFEGNMDKMKLVADCENIQFNLDLAAMNYPILNGGTGCFKMLDMDIYQYSLPTLQTNGQITVNGKKYDINGYTWLDRQWQVNKTPDMTWGWMDFNLDSGEYISFWFPVDNWVEKPFATVLYPDGRQRVVDVKPCIKNAGEFWRSNKYIYDYPTKWLIEIPELNGVFTVKSSPQNQELQFDDVPALNHYEAASTITGTMNGKTVSGYCYVELLATMPWSEIQKNFDRSPAERKLINTKYKMRAGIGMVLKK